MALPRCGVSRYATAWAESLEGAVSDHQFWAPLCRYQCRLLLAEIPKGVDRKLKLKHRLLLWETGQISDLISKVLCQRNSGPLRRRARKMQPQTDEQRGKQASISRSMRGRVGCAAQGSAECRRNWTTVLTPRSSGIGIHPSSAECAEAARIALDGGRYKALRGAHEEAGTNQNRNRFAAALLANSRNTWVPSSPWQEPARGDAFFGDSTFSQSSGRQETCRNSPDSFSTRSSCS